MQRAGIAFFCVIIYLFFIKCVIKSFKIFLMRYYFICLTKIAKNN